MPGIGPYSRPSVLAKLDGRTREARRLRELRTALVAHVGGSPSATQSALIDQAAWLGLHIDLMNRRTAEGRAMTERDSREYLAWVNSQGRLLRQLGLKSPPAPKRSLAEHLAGNGAAA